MTPRPTPPDLWAAPIPPGTRARPPALLLLAAILGLQLVPTHKQVEAQERPHVFQGAEVIPITGPVIPSGTLVVHRGRVVAVGPDGQVQVPGDAVVRDVAGKVIMPGLVDTHSHIGGAEWGGSDSPIQGDLRILDAVNVRDDGFRRARAGGVTTANIMPGSGHLMSGQTIYAKMKDARRVEDLLFCEDPLTDVCGGLKMANGTNPLRPAPPFPQSRARSAALVRARYQAAVEYRDRIREPNGDPSRMPPRDLELEAMVQALDGERIVHHHTHRHDDVLTVLRLQEEFGFRLVLQHVSDAWIVAEEIAESGFPASIILVDAPGGKLEAAENHFRSGAYLERAGAVVGFHTDDGITDSRFFFRQAGLAVRHGMSRDAALYGMTMAGARMMDLEDRIGSLEPGKDADFVILSGDPLSIYTRVEETWIDGEKAFDLSDPVDRAYAVGGYELLPRQERNPRAGEAGR
jgi:imidazolonepropionase-like amidohydrolase